MGRKPLPEDQKKVRLVLYVTPAQRDLLEQMAAVNYQFGAADVAAASKPILEAILAERAQRPDTVRLPVIELADEAEYVPSMRECLTCGKDYDGNLHESCPHEHVPNGKAMRTSPLFLPSSSSRTRDL